MAISSPGIGSGLDVNSIVSQLVSLERRPITNIQKQIGTLSSSVSAWGQIKSGLAKLQDAAGQLSQSGLWAEATATSSNSDALRATASAGVVAGQYQIQVETLAKSQSIRTSSFNKDEAVGRGGRLELELGTWDDGGFDGSGVAIRIDILDTDTLSVIAEKINAEDAGVQAVVVSNGTQESLVLRGTATGAINGFEVRAFDDANQPIVDTSAGLGRLAYFDDAGTPTGQLPNQVAADARVIVEGVRVTSPSNDFANVIPNISFTALAETSGAFTLTVAANTEGMKTAIEAFRTAFNDLSKTIKDLTRADPTGEGNGPLRGDSAAIGILTMIRRYAGDVVVGSNPGRLTDIGISFDRNGQLSVDAARLNTALSNPSGLASLFDNGGLGERLSNFARDALASSGSVGSRERSLQDSIKRKTSEIDKINERVARTEASLRAQYTQLDTKMAAYSGLSSFINAQLASWSKKSG